MPFILDGLESESYDRKYSDRTLLLRILAYFKPFTRPMLLVALTLTLNSLTGMAGPIIIGRALDIVVTNPAMTMIVVFAMLLSLLGVLGWLFNYIRQKIMARVIGDVVLQLRRDVFRATIHHDMSFYHSQLSGKIVSRVTSDTQDFSNVVTLVVDVLSQLLLVVFLTAWLFSINVSLTLLLLAMAPVAIFIAMQFRRIARRVSLDSRKVNAQINSQIQESISGITIAKSFRQEMSIFDTFQRNNRTSYRIGLRRGIVLNLIFPVMSTASALGTALLVYYGSVTIRNGLISAGEWYLFMQAVAYFWWPLMSLASFWSQFQDGLSASERVFALIDFEPAVRQTGQVNPGRLQGRIEFDHVNFSYNDKEIVLADFSLRIEPGETVALVGQTGGGKTSIANLVDRAYEFQSGRILIDGYDLRSLDLGHYRRQIGIVPQDPFLFSGTVADNIRYGEPTAEDEAINAAARKIADGDWLLDLPDGLRTETGFRGSSISLGQRQLVALARVILKSPAIFILDEATASIDPFTEFQIREGLAAVMKDRTAIIIAHRLSTVRNVDRILVIDHGRIAEEGNHHDLLAAGGNYATLYNTYFRHQSLEYIETPTR